MAHVSAFVATTQLLVTQICTEMTEALLQVVRPASKWFQRAAFVFAFVHSARIGSFAYFFAIKVLLKYYFFAFYTNFCFFAFTLHNTLFVAFTQSIMAI